jgi:hypothetical protein
LDTSSKSGGLRAREVNNITLSPRPRAWEPREHWCKSWSPKAGEFAVLMSKDRRVSQLQKRKKASPFSSAWCVLSGSLANWLVPTLGADLPPLRNSLRDTHRSNALPVLKVFLNPASGH